MNSIKNLLITILLLNTTLVFARGGDDVGNGGFAYKQSVNILKMAAAALEEKIRVSILKDLVDHPERRIILQNTLGYDDLDKLSKKNQYRGGRKLAMNYTVNPPTVIVLKSYFEAFAGKTDTELEDASLEVQKRLLHEASHIWGYKEEASEQFAIAFLKALQEGAKRPTNQIDILPNACSCLKGKSDSYGDREECDFFCSQKPSRPYSVLYLDTILGPEIISNSKLGTLYNWCNVQLEEDVTAPQCFLSATDGVSQIANIPVTVNKMNNSLSANIDELFFERNYLIKIVEGKTGSNAQSREIQFRRKKQSPVPPQNEKTLLITPVSQYSCITYGGRVESNGDVSRDSFARVFYYFAGNETPPPMPPTNSGRSSIVCHDEQLNPGNDSVMYPRLELKTKHLVGWDKSEPRFAKDHLGQLQINKMLEARLLNEYNIQTSLDLFTLINYPNRPSLGTTGTNTSLAYIMKAFSYHSGRSYCPTETNFNDVSDPLFQVLKDYVDVTEGLYLAEKEAEIIHDGNIEKLVYGTMFTDETTLKSYGFYVENGLKIRANEDSLHSHTIYYYWPLSDAQDPLIQGNRKLFTVKSPEQINGNLPTGTPINSSTSDKRIGCIPYQKSFI